MKKYAVEFRFPELETQIYAALSGGSFGWAPTLDTALTFDRKENAKNVAANAYGPHTSEYAYVIEVPDAE